MVANGQTARFTNRANLGNFPQIESVCFSHLVRFNTKMRNTSEVATRVKVDRNEKFENCDN